LADCADERDYRPVGKTVRLHVDPGSGDLERIGSLEYTDIGNSVRPRKRLAKAILSLG